MKIENLLNKPLWQMTGEEFMFLSKSVASDSNPRQPEVAVDASSPKYVYGLSGHRAWDSDGKVQPHFGYFYRITIATETTPTSVAIINLVPDKKAQLFVDRSSFMLTSGKKAAI